MDERSEANEERDEAAAKEEAEKERWLDGRGGCSSAAAPWTSIVRATRMCAVCVQIFMESRMSEATSPSLSLFLPLGDRGPLSLTTDRGWCPL